MRLASPHARPTRVATHLNLIRMRTQGGNWALPLAHTQIAQLVWFVGMPYSQSPAATNAPHQNG
jgi:hypothetical protein